MEKYTMPKSVNQTARIKVNSMANAAALERMEHNFLTKVVMNGGSGSAAAHMQRLSSLKPPRDLTLGGRLGPFATAAANKNKITHTPNLNVVRNKNVNVKTSKNTAQVHPVRNNGRGRGAGARGGRGGRGGANSNAFIQTKGVFSEGAGEVNVRKSNTSYSRSADDSTTQMRKPRINKTEQKKTDVKLDEKQLRDLLTDDDVEDNFLFDKTDFDKLPLKLDDAKWESLKCEVKTEKLDLEEEFISTKDTTDGECDTAIAQKMRKLHVKHLGYQTHNEDKARSPESVEELMKLPGSPLILIQMPDSLPCEEGDKDVLPDAAKRDKSEKAGTSFKSPAATEPSEKQYLTLGDMEEGRIGKLLRYKSGKVKLVFGDTYFDMNMGMENGFLQELMSVNANRDERSGTVINLGPILAKVTATPDWERLIKKKSSKSLLGSNVTHH